MAAARKLESVNQSFKNSNPQEGFRYSQRPKRTPKDEEAFEDDSRVVDKMLGLGVWLERQLWQLPP